MIQLIVYAVLAAGLAFGAVKAWDGFKTSISAPYVQAQMKKDQGVVDDLNVQLAAAKKQSTDALADVQACAAASATQSAQVKAWQAEATKRAADAAKARADGLAASQAAKTAIARYQEIASRPPVKDQTCEQKLEATDKLLRDAARARVKK